MSDEEIEALARTIRAGSVRTPATPTAPPAGEPFDLWSFVRDVLTKGAAIDRIPGLGYEAFSQKIDAAASDFAARLRPNLRAGAADDGDRVAALEALLREYGRHAEGCSAAHGDKYRCRCGWREESAALARPDATEGAARDE